jgi:hypothetical protein
MFTLKYRQDQVRQRKMDIMSRGWESKSVEEQQSQAAAPPPDPAKANIETAERKRRRQALELQRERVLSERTSSPHRRSALELALADIEEKLSELGWTIHM